MKLLPALLATTLATCMNVTPRAQDRPTVQLAPAHLATGLDPAATKALVMTFDQPMDPAMHALCGGGQSFPRVLGKDWRDARTFALEVELAPGRVYSMDLACPGSAGFRAKSGATLAPTPWLVATRGEPFREGAAAAAATQLFATIRDHYSYRDRLGIDWTALENRAGAQLRGCADAPAFAVHTVALLATAQDPHISVRWQDGALPTWRREVAANFDLRGLQAVLPRLQRVGRTAFRARTDDGIGYLFVPSFAREQRDEFEQVLQALRGLLDCKSIVLDVRTNGGGDELLARRLAGFFVRGDEVVYAKHRVRDPKARDGFREIEHRALSGNVAPDVFAGPVCVLMGPLNMSSCEAFLLMMKQAPQAALIGVDSFGSSGNPQPHTLLPGLVVMLPSWQALRPDGSAIEGEGIAPHVHVAATAAELATGDPVLTAALARLRAPR